jgi:hypothetical protein
MMMRLRLSPLCSISRRKRKGGVQYARCVGGEGRFLVLVTGRDPWVARWEKKIRSLLLGSVYYRLKLRMRK